MGFGREELEEEKEEHPQSWGEMGAWNRGEGSEESVGDLGLRSWKK